MTLSHNKIKEIRNLRQKKFREDGSLFVVEGEKLVEEALNSGFKVTEVYRKEEIGEQAMERISSLASPSPVLAVVQQRKYSEDELVARVIRDFSVAGSLAERQHSSDRAPVYLALDGIKDPGNLGTIVRLADWFGVAGIFCSSESVELYNPKTVQATMGAIFRIPVVYCSLPQTLKKIREGCSAPVYGTFLDGESILAKQPVPSRGIIVMGSESFGISQQVAAQIDADNRLLIPSFNGQGLPVTAASGASSAPASRSESLNVATATAVILSYFRLTSMLFTQL